MTALLGAFVGCISQAAVKSKTTSLIPVPFNIKVFTTDSLKHSQPNHPHYNTQTVSQYQILLSIYNNI